MTLLSSLHVFISINLLLLLLLFITSIAAFSPSHSSFRKCIKTPPTSQHNNNIDQYPTCLFAKLPKRGTKSNSSGGGFGSSSSSSSSATSQSRTVSGYTGSGTKPLRIAANTFDNIRKKYGKEATTDLYVKSPLNDPQLCWYVGKVIRIIDASDKDKKGSTVPTVMDAVISQKRLILEYAKNQLRPQNFGGPYSKNLEVWIAPGDSEMDVVQNKISLTKVTGSLKDLSEGFSVSDVGFNPEIYVGDEQKEGGLRVKRDENGDPVRAVFEIQ